MLNLTKVYLTKKFEEYYRKAELTLPREFEKREFAFVPFEFLPDFVMFRHISFRSLDEFNSYITSKVPAQFITPRLTTNGLMQKKWKRSIG